MAQTPPPPAPPSGPPRGKHTSAPPNLEDFSEFEGDPTNINQIPQPPSGGARPSSGQIAPQFASGSPSLSQIGGPPQGGYGASVQPYTNPGMQMDGSMTGYGPAMVQVSGVIAQPT